MSYYQAQKNTGFNFNDDFSGMVRIQTDDGEFAVPAQDLLEFIAYCYVLPEKVARLEVEGDYRKLLLEK